MPVKIRLQRKGRKSRPFYHIVAADSRAPRDGKYIERLGIFNPMTNPATIELNFDKALQWLQNGAQPTETAKDILSGEGVLMKNHLLNGVKKGAFSEADAETKYNTWIKERHAKVEAENSKITKELEATEKSRFEAEVKIKEERAKAIIAKNSALIEAAEAATAEAEVEEATAEASDAEATEAPATEAAVEAAPEAVVEAPAEEAKEEKVVEETKEEAPVEEAKKEETPEAAAEVEAPVEEAKEEPVAEEAAAEEVKAEEVKEEEPKVEEAPKAEAKEDESTEKTE